MEQMEMTHTNETAESSLKKSINTLNVRMGRMTSYKHVFLRAVVTGIGYALGAGIVAGLLVFWASRAIGAIDYIPFVQELISSEAIQNSLRDAILQSPGY